MIDDNFCLKGLKIFDECDTSQFTFPKCYREEIHSVLIPKNLIRERIKQLASKIHQVVGDKPLTLISILKGSFSFFNILLDDLTNERHECESSLTVEFIRAQSYENTSSKGRVNILRITEELNLERKDILVVDDICDTGKTLASIVKELYESAGAHHVWTAVLVSKRDIVRSDDVNEDFVAFNIPNKFVVGFGMDYNERFRDLPHICILKDEFIKKYNTSMLKLEK